MWNNGHCLVWRHIMQLYHEDLENELTLLPKITSDHFHLTSYSVIRVNLAAQVLSSTMAAVLQNYGSPECVDTAKLCEMIDSFLDCQNVRSLTEHERKRKPFLASFRRVNDERFEFLENTFLPYFESWKESTTARPGEFTANDRARMFVSWQTFEGLQISSHSLVEAVKFYLNEGMEYVLTECFCQDPVEEYFGNQRALGRRYDNPDLRTFG